MKAPKIYSWLWRPDWIRSTENTERLDPNYENMFVLCGNAVLNSETNVQESLWFRFESQPLMLSSKPGLFHIHSNHLLRV